MRTRALAAAIVAFALSPPVRPGEPPARVGPSNSDAPLPARAPAGATTPPPAGGHSSGAMAELTGAIRGAVLDRGGRGLASASVVALSAEGLDAAETITDDRGSYLLAGLRPGRYVVFAGLDSALSGRLVGLGVEVRPATVSPLDLRERTGSATVRVTVRDGRGLPAEAQAILVAGAPPEADTLGSLLAADAFYLPRPQPPRTVLTGVPEGVYTVVILQGSRESIHVIGEPVRISGNGEVVLEVELDRAEGLASVPAP